MGMPRNECEAATCFSEGRRDWQAVPSWVEYLVQFGYRWTSDLLESRRIALISLPCDSAAAGLVALGALARDIENPAANDVDGHFDALNRYARQYLGFCRECTTRCQPKLRGCGYASQVTGEVRHRDGGHYYINETAELPQTGEQCIITVGAKRKKQERRWIFRNYAADWRIDCQPAPQLAEHQAALDPHPYSEIVGADQVVADNLRSSFSGLCLAGRVSGATATRDVCVAACFSVCGRIYQLQNLLTIHGWSAIDSISRMSFFNTRTGKSDRSCSDARLVVADGHASFLKVLDEPEFQRCDVVGVMHRTIERDELEAVGNRISGLGQWYLEDPELQRRLPPAPCGLDALVLRRRSAQ